MESEAEQCAKALESGGCERKSAAEPIKGVLGGPEYKGGYTCTSDTGSSEQTFEGKANWSERTWVWVHLGYGVRAGAWVGDVSRDLDKLPAEFCEKLLGGS